MDRATDRQGAPLAGVSDRAFFVFNAALSTGALSLLAYLLLIRRGSGGAVDLSFMPSINAALNATAAACLVAGYVAVRSGRPRAHKFLMVSAVAASSLFLGGYLADHFVHGDTRYQGTGTVRVIYLLILASHVLLSMTVVPLALTTFFFAYKGAFARHRRVAKVTLPVWLYVSITGVVVFFMLRGSPTTGARGDGRAQVADAGCARAPCDPSKAALR
jgi:putative membrane protein